MALPVQAEYIQDRFEGGEFVLKTFTNNNVHNTWMYKQDNVTLLVKEEFDRIVLQLGGSSHAVHKTGDLKTAKESVTLSYTTKNVGEINEHKKEVLQDLFGPSTGTTSLGEAFLDEFNPRIYSDDR